MDIAEIESKIKEIEKESLILKLNKEDESFLYVLQSLIILFQKTKDKHLKDSNIKYYDLLNYQKNDNAYDFKSYMIKNMISLDEDEKNELTNGDILMSDLILDKLKDFFFNYKKRKHEFNKVVRLIEFVKNRCLKEYEEDNQQNFMNLFIYMEEYRSKLKYNASIKALEHFLVNFFCDA